MILTNEIQDLEDSREDDKYEPDVSEEDSESDSYPIDQFDLVSSPNDFNTKTLVDFIDSEVIVIPRFQRNFVWDIRRSSRLIESLIVGLPVPQMFLYEQARDRYLVIDGQQRLMSIYYFVKGRFPRKEKLSELRLASQGQGKGIVPKDKLLDDEFFSEFHLSLPVSSSEKPNRFNRQRYSTLSEGYQTSFDLRTIRNILVRQVGPAGDDAMYEIFNRLNSGGVNLTPQEIRRCAYDSRFYDMLYLTNTKEEWRNLVGTRIPDIHMKDVEILLRGFAMLIDGETYTPSLSKFLNKFSQKARGYGDRELKQLNLLLDSFLASCQDLPSDAFHSSRGRFSPMIFEAVFVAACGEAYRSGKGVKGRIGIGSLNNLKKDSEFSGAAQSETTRPANVKKRIERAQEILVLS